MSFWGRFFVSLVCVVVYLLSQVYFGESVFSVAVIPAIITGWLLGAYAGALAGLVAFAFHVVWQWVSGEGIAWNWLDVFATIAWVVAGVLAGGLAKAHLALQRQLELQRQAEDSWHETHRELRELIAELERRNEEVMLLNDFSSRLQSSLTVEEVYKVLRQAVSELLPDCPGALFVAKPGKAFEMVEYWGGSIVSREEFYPDDCLALKRWRTYYVSDPETSLRCQHLSVHVPTYACVPLIAREDICGLLFIQGSAYPLDRHYEYLVSTIAEKAALTIKNLELTLKLQMQATRDGLTGLYNYRYLVEALEREIRRAERHHLTFGVLMLDLDCFKEINDTYGHAAGDAVLCEFGRLLQSCVRSEDIACRYGGDEFVLVLTGASLEASLTKADQILKGFEMLSVKFNRHSIQPGTVSIGVAVYPDHGSNVQELLLAADLALYRAKNMGRGKAMPAQKPV
ncbi:MAG: diguanylate cyclase [Anaerolineae bacterium]|nr:diguanylate cyclase [Anaerolineae bacterium]